jgi:hypothetical protein
MNIFDAHISGSLSVSSSAEIQGNLTVLGIINATISGNTTSADTASFAPRYTLTSSFYAYSGTTNGRLTAIETSTASLNTFTSSAHGRLNSIEGVTGSISSLNTYTGSNNTVIGTLQTSTASLNTFTSSASDRLVALETSTGSINTYTSSNTTNINAIHTSTASLNTYTGSNNTIIGTLQTSTGSLNTYTSSNTTNINAIHTATASLNSFSSSADGRLTSIEGVTGSIAALNTYTGSNNTAINALNSYTSSNTTNINSIHTATSSLNSYTSSNTTNINAIHTATSSLNSFTSSASGRLTALETASSSLNSYTSSNTTAITALNSFTTSFNTAFGLSGANVTVKGNLTVQGSTTQVDSTTVNIGDNIIQLNGTGATNAGIVVRDATSPTLTSGSFLWDSTNDKWVAGPLGSEDEVVLKTASQALTNKTISGGSNTLSNIGNSSLTNSSISIAGTSTSLGGSITAATILTSTGVWSGSAQLPSGVVSGSAQVIANLPSGTVSGSSQVLAGTTIHSGAFFNGISVVSGSGQISFNGITDKPTLVSGSSQVLNGSGVWSGSAQLPSGVVSGSSQITFLSISSIPSGLVSGSSQVLAGTTIHSGSFFNGISVVSGSAQISFNGITDKPALVSGSSQITFLSISSIPSGLVSGSSQITLTSTQVTNGLGYTPYNATNPNGYISSYTETDTLASVTARGASSSTQITLSGKLRMSSDLGVDAGNALYFGREESFGGSNTGGDDYGYITFDNNSTTYSDAGGTERSVLRIGTSNDGVGNVEDNLAIESTANIYLNPAGVIYRGNKATRYTIWDSGNLTNLNQLTNGPGYITGINSSAVTTALGYTPYNATNPNGYITGINSSAVTTALGYTPYNATNPNGYITGISFANVSSKPTTLTGYGITDALPLAGGTLTGDLRFNNSGYGRIAFTDNYHGMILRGNPNNAAGDITAGDVTSLVQHSGDFRFYRTNGTINEIYFQVNATAPYWRGNTIYHAGNIPTWNQNTTGTASNITSYTINQSVGTSNAPTFAGLTSNGTLTVNGTGIFTSGASDWQISLRSTDTWAGMEFDDTNSSPDYIWYHGGAQTFAIGGGGSNVSGKKLHVHGGMTIGSGLVSTSTTSNGLSVEGSITISTNNATGGGIILADDGDIVDLNDAYCSMRFSAGVRIFSANRGGSAVITLGSNGNLTTSGTITENSSIRYKKDIETISYGLDKVLQLRGVTYVKKENNVKEMGVIAEEIAEILPDVVLYDSEGKVDSVSYGRITAVLIEAIKDLKKEINELKNNG